MREWRVDKLKNPEFHCFLQFDQKDVQNSKATLCVRKIWNSAVF